MVLIIGGTTIDFIIKKPLINKATKIEIKEEELFINVGGGASNASYILSYLGTEVFLITKIGKDIFSSIIEDFYKQNPNIKIIKTKKEGKTAISFIFDYEDRIIYTYRGSLNNITEKDLMETIPPYNWLYICSNKGKTLEFVKNLAIQSKKNGKKIFINPSLYVIENEKSLFELCDILVLNKEEARSLTQQEDIKLMLRDLNNKKRITIITDGDKGVYFMENKEFFHLDIELFKKEPIDTTGAGDCFSATFFHFFVKRKFSLVDSLILAAINASYIVTKIGTKHSLSEQNLINTLNYLKNKDLIKRIIKKF